MPAFHIDRAEAASSNIRGLGGGSSYEERGLSSQLEFANVVLLRE
jgi:hypothetical protein